MRPQIFFLVLLSLVLPLAGQENSRDAKVIESWRSSLRQADDMVRAGKFRSARRQVDRVLTTMCDRVVSGEGVAGLFGYATFVRAVAEAGLGNESRARWDFQVAQTLMPDISQASLEEYDEIAALLEPWRILQGTKEWAPGMGAPKVTAPRKLHSPQPKYPFGKLSACLDGPIVVQVIIDQQGYPKAPRLLTTQQPLLGFAALNALRDWRFEPALLGDQPVEVYFNLTVNFELRVCRDPEKQAARELAAQKSEP